MTDWTVSATDVSADMTEEERDLWCRPYITAPSTPMGDDAALDGWYA